MISLKVEGEKLSVNSSRRRDEKIKHYQSKKYGYQ